MNSEQLHNESSVPETTEETNPLKLRNMMQIELALRYIGYEDNDKMLKWMSAYSKGFRDYLNAHPNILTRYTTEKEKVLQEVEQAIYEQVQA
jgi:hypothetical protein